jgi:cobalt-precorrin 5A hydrolase
MKIAVISVTNQGDSIAESIRKDFEIDLFSKSQTVGFDISSISKVCMENYKALIYIASTGIAVRSIAPYIKDKALDPAVIVIDCTGKYAISLLSGHLGGANKLAIEVAENIGAMPIITTASDNLGFLAPDLLAKENGLVIEDLTKAKTIAALLVEGKKVGFLDEESQIKLPLGYEDAKAEDYEDYEGLVYVTNKDKIDFPNAKVLKLIRKNIILGIGCRKDYDGTKMFNQVLEVLQQYNIDKKAIRCISTVEVKQNEKAIVGLSQLLKCELNIWKINEIKEIQHKYVGSDFVEKTIGVRAVCEPCVELSGGGLLSPKLNIEGMTLCIGKYKEGLL